MPKKYDQILEQESTTSMVKDDSMVMGSIEELNGRQQEAMAELKAGGGMDGELFFEKMTQYIATR